MEAAPRSWPQWLGDPQHADQLARLLPLELRALALADAPLAQHTLDRIAAHLAELSRSFRAMVPGWIGASPSAAYEYIADATLLFADVTGFTALADQLGAFGRAGNEHLTNALNRFFGAVVPIALAYGGDLLSFGGDAILVEFHGHEHVGAAIAAASAMQRAVARLDLSELRLPIALQLRMKIGLASGPLLITAAGPHDRRVALALGGVLDATDRAASAGAPGQVRLAASVAARAAVFAELEPTASGGALLRTVRERRSAGPAASQAVVAAPAAEFAQLTALASYLPRSVVAALVAAPEATPGFGERRYVASLFVHLAGLHQLADQLGASRPGLVAAAADRVISRLIALAEAYGGALARIDTYPGGHKLLALFGAPIAHEQSPTRAVLAALALRDALPQLGAEVGALLGQAGVAPAGWPGLELRIGLEAGLVFAGMVGAPARWEYTVMGDAVNVAARLMSSAQVGEVLAGPAIYGRLAGACEAEARALRVKGKPGPIAAQAIRALRLAERAQLVGQLPLVGREAEQHLLGRAGAALKAGHPGVVLIAGEAGIGKSRLVRELPALLGAQAACLLVQPPGLVPSAYGLLREIVAALCRSALGAAGPLSPEQLREAVGTLCPGERAELWPALAPMLGQPPADAPAAPAEAWQRQQALALQRLLTGAAARTPLALICEDLHDADESSLAVLEQLLALGWGGPLLLCATIRTTSATAQLAQRLGERAAQQFPHACFALALGGLGPEAGGALIGELLPGLSATARHEIQAHANGNPLFMQALAQTIRQQRMLAPSSQGEALRAELGSLDIPPTLRELIAAQLDRLPAELRRLAQLIAVIAMAERGAPAWLIERLAEGPQSLAARLGALEQAEVLVADRAEPARFSFRHALYQQVAYDLLLERERQGLHRRASLALHAGREQRRASAEVLAYHCYEGGCWDLAAGYCLEAGQRALRGYAHRDARRLLRRAQGLARRLGLAEHAAQAREGLGELYTLAGRYGPARAQLERALLDSQQCGDGGAQIEAQVRRYRLLVVVGDRAGAYGQAEHDCRAGLALALARLPGSAEAARLYAQLGVIMMRRGEYLQAEQTCHQGLATLPAPPAAQRERVELMQLLGTIAGMRANYGQAIALLHESLPLARELGDPYLVAPMLRDLGLFFFCTGNRDQALSYYHECLQADERTGDMFGRLRLLGHLGLLHMTYGEYERALGYYQEAFQLATGLNLPDIMANIAINLGQLAYFQGELDRAHDYLLRGYTIAQEHGDGRHATDSLYRLGDVVLARGDYQAGLRYGEQALVQARQVASDGFVASALRVIGEAYTCLGRLGEAAAYLAEAQAVQAHVDDPYDQVLLSVAAARLALLQGDIARAGEHGAAAEQLARQHGFTFPLQKAQRVQHDIAEHREASGRSPGSATETAAQVNAIQTLPM